MSTMVYSNEYLEQVTLKDGSVVNLRAIRPDDAPRLQAAFTRLSPQSIYMRFLETFKHLSDEQARALATVDYHSSMALVGCIQEGGEEQIIAVARYAMVDPQTGLAEAAIIVRDDYQNRGLGKIAMDRLARYAHAHGVKAFLGTIHATNNRILNFIKRSGLPFEKKMIEPGIWEFCVFLEEEKATS